MTRRLLVGRIMTSLTLVCHASTSAQRRVAVPQDESLDRRGAARAAAAARQLGRVTVAWCGPERRCQETAVALGLSAEVAWALRDCAYGRWRGRTLAELEAEDPAALTAWLSDPTVAPPGGECVLDLLQRTGTWLDDHREDGGRVVAVTHAAVIRAAVVHVLRAPPVSFWRIDVPPLSRATLQGSDDRWTLRAVGQTA